MTRGNMESLRLTGDNWYRGLLDMGKKAKRIVITTENHETFVLRTDGREHAYGRCGRCGGEVEILTFDQAVSLSGIRMREMVHLTETNELHVIETSSGHLLICKASLDGTGSNTLEEGGDEDVSPKKIT